MRDFSFPQPPVSESAEALRAEVRDFLARELADFPASKRIKTWAGFSDEFSRKLGERGWIGMTWPREYGGQGRSAIERYVVLEEMLAAGAPVAAHWIADRQSGPLLLKVGTEEQKRRILPMIARGECYFCIGMSEPDSGSDLAATRTRAVRVDGGWRINGTKLWTTYAHKSHYIILYCRTGQSDDRHRGTSQFLIDLKTPGITVRPIVDISGATHFNEVVFEDVLVSDDALLGNEGEGWKQVMSELAYERSGPERFLSSFILLVELMRVLGQSPDAEAKRIVGRLGAHFVVMRQLSRSVAGLLQQGADPTLKASVVKDLGAVLEQELPEVLRGLADRTPDLGSTDMLEAVHAWAVLNVPSFSLRGGTREILRGIIARGLGLR